MNSICLISNIKQSKLLINLFAERNWIFICKDNIFSDIIKNMKLEKYTYLHGKTDKNMFIMHFTKDGLKITYIINIVNITDVQKYLDLCEELYIYRIIPDKDILNCIGKNGKLICLSNTNYSCASINKSKLINYLLRNNTDKINKYEYYDILTEKIYEMNDIKMLCRSYLLI